MSTVVFKNNTHFTLHASAQTSSTYVLENNVHATINAHIFEQGLKTDNTFNYVFELGERSNLTFFVYIYDIAQADISITLHMRGIGARAACKGLYVLEKSEQVRINILQEHTAQEATTEVLFKGILTDSAQAFFKGKIVVPETGTKAHAQLYNKNIMLSAYARATAMPQLEVLTNDVQCKHGSATSRLDAQQVLYAQSRGLDSQKTYALLLESFVADCIPSFDAPLVRNKVSAITQK